MKIPFDIKYRPQIESGEYKVETFSGYPVTIYRWDFDDGTQTPIMGSYVFEDGKEYVGAWNDEGHFDLMSPHDLDLFIVTPEPELTDWQKFISGCLQKHGLLDCSAADRIAKECSTELLELARKELAPTFGAEYMNGYEDGINYGRAEALKDLPRWKKVGLDTGQTTLVVGYTKDEDKLYRNGYVISLPDLEKLPKEK